MRGIGSMRLPVCETEVQNNTTLNQTDKVKRRLVDKIAAHTSIWFPIFTAQPQACHGREQDPFAGQEHCMVSKCHVQDRV